MYCKLMYFFQIRALAATSVLSVMVGGKVHNTREGNAFFQEMTRGLSLHLLPRLRQLGNSNGWASII